MQPLDFNIYSKMQNTAQCAAFLKAHLQHKERQQHMAQDMPLQAYTYIQEEGRWF